MTALPRLCPSVVPSFRADGTLTDLAAPSVDEVDFRAMAGRLSRIARFNGVPEAGGYSVAQHSVMGAQTLLNEGEDELTAALFLLHDGHEYLIGDQVRPFFDLMKSMLRARNNIHAWQAFQRAYDDVKAGWDAAIYAAAGLPAPTAWSARMKTVVKAMDERMLVAEARALFGPAAAEWAAKQKPLPAPRLTGALRPWGAMKAEEAFIGLFTRLRGEAVLFKTANRRETAR